MIETGKTMNRTTRSKALTEENLDVFEKYRIFVATNGFCSKLYTKIRKNIDINKYLINNQIDSLNKCVQRLAVSGGQSVWCVPVPGSN